MEYFGQLVANGLVLGSIYALTAVSYSLVYGVVRMVNFAFGELFMIGAFVTVSLMTSEISLFGYSAPMPGLPFMVAAALAIVITAALGVLIDVVAYRPLRKAPRLAPLITSIAISVMLQSLAQTIWGTEQVAVPRSSLSSHPPLVLFESIYITRVDILVVLVAIAAMIGLSIFIHYSRLGRAMRATAEDQTAASLLGIPVNRVVGVAFALGSGFAALSGLLYAQTYGFTYPTMGFLPSLKALTAAVLGGIGSVPGAALGGFLLGQVEALAGGYLPNGNAYKDVFSFLLLIILLYVKPQGLLGRPEMNTVEAGSLLGTQRPGRPKRIDAFLRPVYALFDANAGARSALYCGLLIACVCVALILPSDYWVRVFMMVMIYALLATGLNIVVGFAGLLDLGFVAFWAVGAYFSAIIYVLVLKNTFGVDPVDVWWLFYINLILGGVAASILAVILGAPTLRLRGDYLAIMTLGFGEIVRIVSTNWVELTRGPMGIPGIPVPAFAGFELSSARSQLIVSIVLAAIVLFLVARIVRSYVGRAWVAIREDEYAAESMGILGPRYKLYAYAASGFIGGTTGVFYAHTQQFISPLNFSLFENIVVLLIIVLGGLGTFIGPFIGALIWVVVLQVSPNIPLVQAFPETRFAVLGLILLLLMLYRPQGLGAIARVKLVMPLNGLKAPR